MSKTIFHQDIAISEFNNGHAVYSFTNTVVKGDSNVTMLKIDTKDKAGVIAAWGPGNNYPQEVIKAVKKNASAIRGLDINIKSHYGNGIIIHGEDQADDAGKKTPRLLNLTDFPDIKDFFIRNQIPRFTKETITDLEWWSIAFPEYILSNDFNKINRVKRQKSPWCRYEVMNNDNGLIENLYISQKFGLGSVSADSEYVSKVALIDSYWSPEEVREYCRANRIYKFIRPIFYPMVDEAYYPESSWHAVIKSGWLDNSNSIPEYIKAIFNNQVTIKYLIEIDERYFQNIYDKWQEMDATLRIEIRRKVIDTINESLSGNSNAGKSIQSMFLVGPNNEQISAVKITPIDDKFKDGKYLPEASAANAETLVALGIHATLIGGAGVPGGGMGAGSGSDIREAFTVLSALKRFCRDTALEPLEFIQGYNSWDPIVKFNFENTILTTLDKNPTGEKKAA